MEMHGNAIPYVDCTVETWVLQSYMTNPRGLNKIASQHPGTHVFHNRETSSEDKSMRSWTWCS